MITEPRNALLLLAECELYSTAGLLSIH